jgi:hypothetical protein
MAAKKGKPAEAAFGVGEQVNAITWNADGTLLAAVGQYHLTLFDEVGQPVHKQVIGSARDICCHPSRPVVAVSTHDDHLILFDVERRAVLATLKEHDEWLSKAAFSPDGTRLASLSDGADSVSVWDWEKRKVLWTFKVPAHPFGVAWFPDNERLVAVGARDALHLFDGSLSKTGTMPLRLAARLRFSPDGKALYTLSRAAERKGVWRWDLATKAATPLKGLEKDDHPSALDLHPKTGDVFGGGCSGDILRWKPDGKRATGGVAKEQGPRLPKAKAPPERAPRTLKQLEALQTGSLKSLRASCETIAYDEAVKLLRARKLGKPDWLPGEAPEGVLLHKGDLELEALDLDHRKDGVASGLIVDGNLNVGLIENGEQDFGPFLVVLGDLTADHVAVGGAPVEIAGRLKVTGAFHGYYNHGTTRVGGDVDIGLLIADDYLFTAKGKVRGTVLDVHGEVEGTIVGKKKKPVEVLHPTFLEVDGEDINLKSKEIYRQVACGGSVRVEG